MIYGIVGVIVLLLIVAGGGLFFFVSIRPGQYVNRVDADMSRENVDEQTLFASLAEGEVLVNQLKPFSALPVAGENTEKISRVLVSVCSTLSNINEEKKDLKQALNFQKRAVDYGDSDIKSRYHLCELYLLNEEYDAAEKMLNSFEKDSRNLTMIISDRGTPELHKLKLTLSLHKKDLDSAEETLNILKRFGKNYQDIVISGYEKLMELTGTDERFGLPMADILMEKKSYNRACDLYETIHKKLPRDEKVVFSLVTAAERSNNTQKAIDVLNEYLEYSKDRVKVLKYLEHLYQRTGQTEKLVDIYQELIKLSPQVDANYHSLVKIYKNLHRLDEAIATLQQLIKDDPDEPLHYFSLADICLQAGHSEEACIAYEKVLSYYQNNPDVNLIKQIMERIETFIKAKPDDINAHQILIRARSLLRFDNSKNYYRMAKIYFARKDYDKAFQELQKVTQHDGEMHLKAAFLTGICWMKQENYDLAIRHFQQLLSQDTKKIKDFKQDILYELGTAYEKINSLQDAVKSYQEILLVDYKYKDVKDKLDTLKAKIRGESKPMHTTTVMKGTSTVKDLKITRFDILEELGKGGMGVVYKARDTKLGRMLALKVLPASLKLDPDAEARFLREAQSAAVLNHPNIVQIYDVLEEGGTKYIAMEYVEGKTLRDIIEKEHPGGTPLDLFDMIFPQVSSALSYAHSHGIIHRDIKPENVMLNKENQIKIMDFGLAKVEAAATMTQAGVAMGTIQYMSPEQMRGEAVDSRTDIYSVTSMFYEMLVGQPPFPGTDIASIMYNQMHTKPPPPSSIKSDLPKGIDDFIMKGLEKKADLRYGTMDDMIDRYYQTMDTIKGCE